MRRADASERAMLAAALAAAAGFVSAAAIDWVWQVTVVPVAFLLLAAAVLRSSGGGEVGGVAGRLGSQRTALAAVSVLRAGGDRCPDAGDQRRAAEPGGRPGGTPRQRDLGRGQRGRA